ncbi:hypothetical protein [Streptomyces sp. NPDC102360]|uniref:hypothetical protein n=1 Tax=Streptomyces sp. NPDC102360 TaxID=3366160 RepID=UPI0038189987
MYVSQVTPHIPAAYFSAPRARGISVLIAPLTFVTSSPLPFRIHLAVLSGSGLFLALRVWRHLRPAPVLALPGRRGLAGLGTALATGALMRPSDAVWLALPSVAAALCVRRWRRPALLPVLCGLSLAVPYLLLIDYAAPRFLLPAYALPAIPVADALASVPRALPPRQQPARRPRPPAPPGAPMRSPLERPPAARPARPSRLPGLPLATGLQRMNAHEPCRRVCPGPPRAGSQPAHLKM